jgi:hypothetical protein
VVPSGENGIEGFPLFIHGRDTAVTGPSGLTLVIGGSQIIPPIGVPSGLPLFTLGHIPTYETRPVLGLRDATITSTQADTERGLEDNLIVGADASGINRVVVDFDISFVPSGATIVEAHIEGIGLVTASGAQEFRTYRTTSSWVEEEVTWNSRSSGVAWTTPGSDFSPTTYDSWTAGTTSGVTKIDIDATNVIQEVVDLNLSIACLMLKEHVEASLITQITSLQNPLGGPILVISYSTSVPDLDLVVPEPFGVASGACNLFMHCPVSGGLDLCINGVEPRPNEDGPVCPTVSTSGALVICDEMVQCYRDKIDALINQLGKNVILNLPKIKNPCPNCEFDSMRGRSRGIYIIGGPRPFGRGQTCPWCKGNGFEETENQVCIKALTHWRAKDLADYGIDITDYKGVVRLKTYLAHLDDLRRAETATVNHDIEGLARYTVRLIRGPYPRGFRNDTHCLSFWELLDD